MSIKQPFYVVEDPVEVHPVQIHFANLKLIQLAPMSKGARRQLNVLNLPHEDDRLPFTGDDTEDELTGLHLFVVTCANYNQKSKLFNPTSPLGRLESILDELDPSDMDSRELLVKTEVLKLIYGVMQVLSILVLWQHWT